LLRHPLSFPFIFRLFRASKLFREGRLPTATLFL